MDSSYISKNHSTNEIIVNGIMLPTQSFYERHLWRVRKLISTAMLDNHSHQLCVIGCSHGGTKHLWMLSQHFLLIFSQSRLEICFWNKMQMFPFPIPTVPLFVNLYTLDSNFALMRTCSPFLLMIIEEWDFYIWHIWVLFYACHLLLSIFTGLQKYGVDMMWMWNLQRAMTLCIPFKISK